MLTKLFVNDTNAKGAVYATINDDGWLLLRAVNLATDASVVVVLPEDEWKALIKFLKGGA